MASTLIDEARVALGGIGELFAGVVSPTLRLGVTGLSRSGKTVFITALIHNLLHGGRLPLFNAAAEGRIVRAYLEPQTHDEIPRFAYEDHVALLTGPDRAWPQGTQRISELRLTIDYQARGIVARNTHGGQLRIDIVDYPGEWLLDLPLMSMRYEDWSQATLAQSRSGARLELAGPFHAHLATLEPARAGERSGGAGGSAALHRLSRPLPPATMYRCPRCRRAASSCPAISKARPSSPSLRSTSRRRPRRSGARCTP